MTEPYRLSFMQPTLDVPSENEARRNNFGSRGRAQGFHAKLASWKQAAAEAWKQQRFGPVGAVLGQPCALRVRLGFRTNARRDPHNYVGTVVKSIVDGLVLVNVWPDDTAEWVEVLEPECVVLGGQKGVRLPCHVDFTLKGVI